MAGETIQSGFTTVAAYVAANMSPYFRTNVVMMNLINTQNFREKTPGVPGSNALKFGKMGNVTVAVTAEAASATKSTYTETNLSIIAQKASAYVELTLESELFGNDNSSLDQLASDAARAAADKFDVDALALADGFSASTGTTTVALTVNALKDAPYKVRLNKVPGPLVYVLHPTNIRDIQASIITSGAALWGNPTTQLDILGGNPAKDNGRVGQIFGVDIYESTNTKSINAAADWAGLCFSPRYAYAAGILGRFITQIVPIPQTGLNGLSLHMFYQLAEWNDGAGCYIIGKQ